MNLSLLRSTALFADLDEAQLGRVAEICLEQTYRAGETIFREGEPGTFFGEMSCSCVRMLSGRLRATNDNLRTFLAMSMF